MGPKREDSRDKDRRESLRSTLSAVQLSVSKGKIFF